MYGTGDAGGLCSGRREPLYDRLFHEPRSAPLQNSGGSTAEMPSPNPAIVRLGREAEGEGDGPGRLTAPRSQSLHREYAGERDDGVRTGDLVHRAVTLEGAFLQSETVGQHGDGDGSDGQVDGVKEDPLGEGVGASPQALQQPMDPPTSMHRRIVASIVSRSSSTPARRKAV